MDRRDFLKQAGLAGGLALAAPLTGACAGNLTGFNTGAKAKIAFVKTADRVKGLETAIDLLSLGSFGKKDLFVKPNFNSADSTPGSTHTDLLSALLEKLWRMDAGKLVIGDRSGMGNTREVMKTKDIFYLGKEHRADVVVFDELQKEDWEPFTAANWKNGFYIPKQVKHAGGIIQTCCLKTHQYGGHFTLSLKNSVGFAAKRLPGEPYNFMTELHTSSKQRTMIAEINTAYKPDLVVLDGVEAFTDGGPHQGTKVDSQVMIAGTDRVAIDAIGVAILRHFGTTAAVSEGKVFDQAQIKRAVELGLGVSSPDQIEFITPDKESKEYAEKIKAILNQ